MKKIQFFVFCIIFQSFSLSSTWAQGPAETVWVPIMLGGITFFVPLGEVTPPDPVVPITPMPDPIVDANLRACIDAAKIAAGVVNDDELTLLVCNGDGGPDSIVDLTGISTLINLELFAFGGNRVTDMAPLQGLSKLESLFTETVSLPNYTNELDDADFIAIRNLPALKTLGFGTPTLTNNPHSWLVTSAAFSGGFSNLTTVEVWSGGVSPYNATQQGLPCSLLDALFDLPLMTVSSQVETYGSGCSFGY